MLFGGFLWHKVGDIHKNWERNNLWNLLCHMNYCEQIFPGVSCRRSLLPVLQPLICLSGGFCQTNSVRFSTALSLWTPTSEHCNVLQRCKCPHWIMSPSELMKSVDAVCWGWMSWQAFRLRLIDFVLYGDGVAVAQKHFQLFHTFKKCIHTFFFSLHVWFLINDDTPCSSHVSLLRLVCIIAMPCYFFLFHYGR